MKVYTRSKDRTPLFVIFFIFLMFIGVPIIAWISYIQNLPEAIAYDGLAITLLNAFLFVGIYLFIGLFKKPRKFTATLIEKINTLYQDEEITLMSFKPINPNPFEKNKYIKCFSKGPNNLYPDKKYYVYLSVFNCIVKIDETETYEEISMPGIAWEPVLNFSVLSVLITIGLELYGVQCWNDYYNDYIISIIVLTIILIVLLIIKSKIKHKEYK